MIKAIRPPPLILLCTCEFESFDAFCCQRCYRVASGNGGATTGYWITSTAVVGLDAAETVHGKRERAGTPNEGAQVAAGSLHSASSVISPFFGAPSTGKLCP